MLANLPETAAEVMNWEWSQFEPYFSELELRELSDRTVEEWLKDWTALSKLGMGRISYLRTMLSRNTADTALEEQLNYTLKNILPPYRTADNRLVQKLLESGLEPAGMEIPLQKIRVSAEIFREANLPLSVEEQKLSNEYAKITGAQSVTWQGREMTISQLRPLLQNPDRSTREQAWHLSMERQLQDREALNNLWSGLFKLRGEMAANAGLANYREMAWKQRNRFDYTPEDCETFHAAIEAAVVPAAHRVAERHRKGMGLDKLRPWDVEIDPTGLPALHPFKEIGELDATAEKIFRRVDPELGDNFNFMRQNDRLDLDNRLNKAPGGYMTYLPLGKKLSPFIFMNAVGVASDVITMLHEAGHAFHTFEVLKLPYHTQWQIGSEFNEVASMAMELLASPYLAKSEGGYYSEKEARRARVAHLEKILLFWPYMAVVDAFQLWAYVHPAEAVDPANCDRQWGALWDRFMNFEDWRGLDEAKETGWHRKLHIFQYPFYYVEYGMAQLGAIQIWANSLKDHKKAVADYRAAHRLGGTASLPTLYATAGARFNFDTASLGDAVSLIERTIDELLV